MGGIEDRWRQIVWGKRKYGRRERKGMRQKERQRVRTQRDESSGRSVTRLRPHLSSASLPTWTINQQREQGKINKNSPAGTTAHRTIASLTDKSPQPSTSIKQLYSLTSHFLLSLRLSLISFPLPLPDSFFFFFFLLFSLFITVDTVIFESFISSSSHYSSTSTSKLSGGLLAGHTAKLWWWKTGQDMWGHMWEI